MSLKNSKTLIPLKAAKHATVIIMPIVKINHSNQRINSIESVDGQRIELNDLVSTIPIHALAKAMVPPPPDHILDEIEMLEYRSIMICVLFLDIERFSENASIN